MFVDSSLNQHMTTSPSISSNALVSAEWNMNYSDNLLVIGNYRYRPGTDSNYSTILNSFDPQDQGNFYTDATNADTVIDGGYDDEGVPTIFLSQKQKEEMLYSLEDCFGKFRPRSGINKSRYFEYNRYIHHSNEFMSQRPRFYPGHKNDVFKYWSSYRTELGIERGIANRIINNSYYIDDAAPFVVYKEPVPANRVVVKMQTGVGSVDLGPFSGASGTFDDPFYGDSNKQIPVNWKIQGLTENGSWSDLTSFNANSTRSDGSDIIGDDGYVEIQYGLQIPEKYNNSFNLVATVSTDALVPQTSLFGQAYLIKEYNTDIGILKIWNGSSYDSLTPTYGWSLLEDSIDRSTKFVTEFDSPEQFLDPVNGVYKSREFEYLYGLRIVVETMRNVDSVFDLIELSPRLTADISDYTVGYSVSKIASDIGKTGMPVGELLASTGSMTLFDPDNSFNPNNENSIISKYLTKNIQIKFYEIILDVNNYDYYVPIKTLYSDGFPEFSNEERTVSLTLRDLFFHFESLTAPQILIPNVSLSYAVATLLDSIGFTNYLLLRVDSDIDPIIPYFFIGPDTSVAEVLNSLAVSAQCAMFFDEYNNFVLMNKNYMLPSEEDRDADMILYGSKDFEKSGILRNGPTESSLSNLIQIASQNNDIYNAGTISYTSRYIQRSYGSIRQASLVDQEKTWIYKPALLWEVTGEENTKPINNETNKQSSYVLSAVPLNSTLSETVPYVSNYTLSNNTIDLGEAVYWLSRYNGYFYSSGEVIRYDAVQYNVASVGNVWITSGQEYQNYFSTLKFNGKIYPTGLVRIFAEPYYEEVSGVTRMKNGEVRKHGRGQFGTTIVKHSAGIDPYWTSDSTVKVSALDSRYLFSNVDNGEEREISPIAPVRSTRNGIIKNFLSTQYTEDSAIGSLQTTSPGTIQSSALIFNGPNYAVDQTPSDYVMYVPKALDSRFTHFGTRMRIIGKIENSETKTQTAIGATTYYNAYGDNPTQSPTITGGSGGLGIMIDPASGGGYYFEIIALSESNLEDYEAGTDIHNIMFYKVGDNATIPTKLWSGLGKVLVDDGKFTGQARMVAEENPTVYDLSVEYRDIGNSREFKLYINGKLIALVLDDEPLPVFNNIAPFVRGSSRCMFENLYAISANYGQNTSFALDTPVTSAINDSQINFDESFSRYALSGIVQSSYLSGISPAEPPKYNIYFEEFGSIMREAAYFNVRYDRAYPALYAKLSPTFNNIKGYAVSGFMAGSYGAEFLIFNSTDTVLSLDESSGNYLRIQGVTFTQSSDNVLTMDDYFKKNSDFGNPVINNSGNIVSPLKAKSEYLDIKASRGTYGVKEFSINPAYIQSQDAATELMGWLTSKLAVPRRSIGMSIFPNPAIQLGDIVQIRYQDNFNVNQVALESDRFVVYSIEYSRTDEGPEMKIYLSEVK